MSEQQGWIKTYRKIIDWEWYTDANVFRVFMHILLSANYSPKKWHGMTVNAGELVTSIGSLAAQLKLTEQQIRTALNKLEKTGEITKKSTNRNTVIFAVNYEFYQSLNYEEQQSDNNQVTTKQQSDNNQITTKQQSDNNQITTNKNNKNVKNDKNVENNTRARGKYANVFLSDKELEKLKDECPISWERKIDNLSEYLVNNPHKHYASHFDTIWKWYKQDTKNVSFNTEKAEMRALDRTRNLGTMKNPKRKRG